MNLNNFALKMEDFDIFTDKIDYSKPFYNELLNKFIKDAPVAPNGPNYHCAHKLLGLECLAASNEKECAFYLSESVSSTLRTMAIYRHEQIKAADNKLQHVYSFVKPIKEILIDCPMSKDDEAFFLNSKDDIAEILSSLHVNEEEPFHERYLRFSQENNVCNFMKILHEFPKEWTVIQLTAPYNPNENLKPYSEYRMEVDALYVSLFTNDYLDDHGPLTVVVPSNVTKEGEKPLFVELYSLLEENYKTIDNAQFLNNKRLVQNYWTKRGDIDLRMKSVLNIMDKEWLGGFGCLLTGNLKDSTLKEKIVRLVDEAISDWGFIRLTRKQKILLYNLIESSPVLTSEQIKTCIRRILTEHANPEEFRTVLKSSVCSDCNLEFKFLNELCLKCLKVGFEEIHHFTVVDGIKAFSKVANQVKDDDEWAGLKKARRHPVILIVDELLDTFPWESLPILTHHPVSRIDNIHFLYYLYKVHEDKIVDGYFTTNADVGRYVINPENNLDRMEKRMSSFVEYWCSKWTGYIGMPAPPEDLLKYLTEADIYLYCGHGDGCHFANGSSGGVEAAVGTRVATVLSGCGSVRLVHPGGKEPPQGAHRHLHIAGSPLVVGMLWEVTDLEVDKVVSTVLSLYVPSDAPLSWQSVGKQGWSQGVLDTTTEQKTPFVPEPDLLRAVARARGSTNFIMIASSVVARGLPVRLKEA